MKEVLRVFLLTVGVVAEAWVRRGAAGSHRAAEVLVRAGAREDRIIRRGNARGDEEEEREEHVGERLH